VRRTLRRNNNATLHSSWRMKNAARGVTPAAKPRPMLHTTNQLSPNAKPDGNRFRHTNVIIKNIVSI